MSKLLRTTQDSGEAVDSFGAIPIAQPSNEHRSADAIAWEVSIDAHGSTLVEGVAGGAPQLQPFQEHTCTIIVSPKKGVFSMSTPVSVGQILLLTNLKSEKNVFCRIVDVRKHGNEKSYVEVELTTATPEFWGVDFESHRSSIFKRTVSDGSSAAQPVDFAPVGEQSPPVAARNRTPSVEFTSLEDLRRPIIANLTANSAKRKVWQSWRFVTAITFVFVLTSAGLLLWALFGNDTLDLKSISAPPPVIATSSKTIYEAAQPVKAEQTFPVPAFRLPDSAFGSKVAEISKPDVSTKSDVREMPSARSNASAHRPITDLFGSLRAHPFTGSRKYALSRPDSAAPDSANPPASEPTPAQVALNSPILSPPLLHSTAVYTSQGPRLVFSQTPEYPAAAKLTHAEGDVVIEALINQSGNVVDASVVSGSPLFREAALKAVRLWRYEPRIVSGQPVPSKLVITIRFRL